MTTQNMCKIETTGGRVDDMVMALIDAAQDKEQKVREIIASSVVELGRKQPALVLTSCLVYLQKNTKLGQNHRVSILLIMGNIVKETIDSLDPNIATEIIKQASAELTQTKDVVPEWQKAASALMVSMGTRFCNEVMDELLQKFQPGVLPHFFVVETLADLALVNVFGMLPFLKGTLGSMLPMLGLAKAENMRWVFSSAIARFCESILDYVANIEKAPDPTVKKEAFETEVNNAFDVLLNVWINTRETKLRVAIVDALGQMSLVMSQQRLQEQLPKLLQCILGLYKKHTESYHITQGLCMVLDAATDGGSTMLEPHFDQLINILFPQVCQYIDYTNPLTVKNHNEVLRCFAVLAKSFSDRLVGYLIQRLEPINDKIRIGSLMVLRHLINSAVPYMENKKPLVLSGLKILLHDPSNKVKKVLAQTVIAMAHHGYLELEGGQLMIEFILRQCSLAPEPPGKRSTDVEYVSNDALRSMCDNVLQLLSTTVEGMDRVLWPYVLEFLVLPDYTRAITVLAQTIAHIAGKKRAEASIDLEIDFDRLPNVPKPPAIFARFLVMAGHPGVHVGKNRGLPVLMALKHMGPILNEYLTTLWDTVIPKLTQHLEDASNSEDEWQQKIWEDLLLKFLSRSLDQISDEEWFGSLADAFGHQLLLYTEHPQEKNFLYKCLGLTLKKCERKEAVTRYLDTIFQTVKHTTQVEREGCAIAAGFTASAHLDAVLSKLEPLLKLDTKRSTGLLGFIKDSVSSRSDADDKLRATVILSYGYVTMYAPSDLIVSRLEAVIARMIMPQFDSTKDAQVKQNLVMSVDLIARAMHPGHLGHSHSFALRTKLLGQMQAFVKAEKPTHLNDGLRAQALGAAANLVRLDPVLTNEEMKVLVSTALESVMPLPSCSTNERRAKEESYQELVDAEQKLKSAVDGLQELLTQIFLKDVSPTRLYTLIQLLHEWSVSTQDHERHRATSLTLHLVQTHLNTVDPVRVATSFSSLGSIVGWLVPRCSDPSQPISSMAINALQCVYRAVFKYEGKGAEHKDTMIDALPTLTTRMEKADSNAMFSIISDLGTVIHKKTAPDQLMPLLETLFVGLLDQQAHSSSAACVVINSILKARGGELHSQVKHIALSLLNKVEDITVPQTHTGVLRCVRTLTSHHLLTVIEFLLDQPIPLKPQMAECWRVIGQDDKLTASVLDHLLDSLARIMPYEEKPNPKVKDTTMMVATIQSMSIICCLTELCLAEDVKASVINNYPRLLSVMMLRVASCVSAHPPKVTREEQRSEKTVTVTKEVTVDPCQSAITGCQQIIQASHSQTFLAALNSADVWSKLASEEDFVEGFRIFARCMVECQSEYVSKLITCLSPSLGSMYDPQRIMTAAVFAEFVACSCAGDLTHVEMLTNSFLGRLIDSNLKVRMMCVRGLGNISHTGPEQVQKFSTTVLSAMMSGMDDKDDVDDDITLEAMEGLSKILKQIDEGHIRAVLINVALKIRPCFEKEKESVRAAAYTLFGDLSRFGDGPSKEPFLEQIHTNLVSLLLHLNDPDTEVIKACKAALQQLGPLLPSKTVNTMFQKHLLEGGSLHYGEFINDLTKVLNKDFPEKANFYAMGAVNFFKSTWPEIKCNAAIFTGFHLGNMPKEMYDNISKEHVSNALVLLLKDPSPEVRIKAAEAISSLHHL